ncbi:MAG: glutamate mutase L [Spirochaetaceae bacterium]|jgi:uncharacterized protein (TIGR01319 family)|nr:glutamate mutase L [Spirochaetaceae bacterium]
MEAVLLIDFGSTNTKVTAVDPAEARLLGTAAAFTTVGTDIGEGLAEALGLLQKETGPLTFVKRFACSSAAGGLRMAASGLVPSLTASAARLAALGAGAKIVGLYSYELTEEDGAAIAALKPDIFLLTGGVDGGNKDCILHNAAVLAAMKPAFPVLVAGNRAASGQCLKILAGLEVIPCPNVLPRLGKLNIEPVQEQIRALFLRRIINARGLSREQELISGILMPTPSAVKRALELLAQGMAGEKERKGETGKIEKREKRENGEQGFGELAAVDLGGATTDVYSVASGLPQTGDTVLKGIPEPFSKRTVEGDIGMRYSAAGVLEAAGAERLAALSGLPQEAVEQAVRELASRPDAVAGTPEEEALDYALAAAAVEAAMERHAGTLEEAYTPAGPVFVQTGKDLRNVGRLILTGGAVIRSKRAGEIAGYARYTKAKPHALKPAGGELYVDKAYILAAMGLLAETAPGAALRIMKREIQRYGT